MLRLTKKLLFGIEAVLDNLQRRARVTAIATSPYVMAPMPDGQGGREPPIDAGAGSVRLLDRPLWGRRELFVRTAPSFAPDPALYRGLRYQPAAADDLTRAHGHVVADTIRAKIGRPIVEDDRLFLLAYYRQARARMERDLLFGKRRENKYEAPT